MCAKRCISSSLTNTVQLNGDTGRGCAVTRAPLKPFARAYCSPNSTAFVLSTYWNPTYVTSSAVAATDGHLRAVKKCRGKKAGENDAGEPEIDDERRADRGAPVRQRREHHRAVARDDVARDMGGDGERADPVERLPTARLPEDFRQQPGDEKRPQRQQQQGMRDAAVVEQVLHRSGVAEDEVQVRRRAGEKSRRDAPRDRTRFSRRCCPREQRSGQRVSKSIQTKSGTDHVFREKRGLSLFFQAARFFLCASLTCICA